MRGVLRKIALNHSVVFNFSVDDGRGVYAMIQHDRQLPSDVRLGELSKTPGGILRENEIHLPCRRIVSLPGLLDAIGFEVAPGYFRGPANHVPDFPARIC